MFQDGSKVNKQMFVIVFIAVIIGQAASNMVFFFVPLHLSTEFNLDFSIFSKVTTAALFLSVLFSFIGGWLSDVIGRIRTIFLGVLLGSISSGLMIFVPTWQIVSITYILSTIAIAIINVAFWVLMIENSPWKNRGLFIGLVLGGKSVFEYQSQEFAAGLINSVGQEVMELFGLITFIIAIMLLVRPIFKNTARINSIETKIQNSEGTSKPQFATILIWVLLIQVISEFGFGVGNLWGSIYSRENISRVLGLELELEQGYALIEAQYAFIGTTVMLFVMTLSGWLSDKYGERRILALTLCVAGIGGLLPFLILQNFYSLLSQILVIGLCSTIFSPAINSFLSKILPENKRGLIYGIFRGISGGLFIALIPVHNSISDKYQEILPFVFLLLLTLAFLVWWKIKLPVQGENPVPDNPQA